uniref:hypothetical protein n=1 Tax=Streptomyces olivaceus TaxID=47716 RepID=UPI004056F46F
MPQPTPAHSSRTSSRSALSAPSRPSLPFRPSRPFPPHATSAPAHIPVLTVTADTLVVADFGPRTRRPRPR